MSLLECHCFLQFLKPEVENLWGIVCVFIATSSRSYFPWTPAGLFAGLCWFLLLVKMPQDHTQFSGYSFLLNGFAGKVREIGVFSPLLGVQRASVHCSFSPGCTSFSQIVLWAVEQFRMLDWCFALCGIRTGQSDPWDHPHHWKGRITKINPSDFVW